MIRTFSRPISRPILGAALVLTLLVAGVVAAGPAVAARAGCEDAVRDLRRGLAALRVGSATTSTDTADTQERELRGRELYQAALTEHPDCADDFQTLAAELQAAAGAQKVVKGTPFLGPIGWLWNNVYYRVFSGNTVMMAIFGWALLLSPVIFVLSVGWVLRGSRGAFRRPFVPDHLRSET